MNFDDLFHLFGDDDDIGEDESLDFDMVALEMERKREVNTAPIESPDEVEMESFESPMEDPLPSYLSKDAAHQEELKQMAHLSQKFHATKLFIGLWQIYLDSGMGRLNTNPDIHESPHIWPIELKKMINQQDVDHVTCLNYAQDYLRRLNGELEQYQTELNQRKRQYSWYNKEMNDQMERYVREEYLQGLELKIQRKILLIKLDYRIQLSEMEFNRLNPNQNHTEVFQQLIQAKQDHLKSQLKVDLLKQQVLQQKLPGFLHHLQLPLIPIIDQVNHPTHRSSLQNRYERILQQTRSDLMFVYIAAAETKMREYQRQFDETIQRFDQELLPSMIDLLFRRLKLMDERMKQWYQYKIHFFVQAPTVKAE